MSCGVGHRCGSDPAMLRLWYRTATAAQIWPLAWELCCGNSPKKEKKKRIPLEEILLFHTRKIALWVCINQDVLVSGIRKFNPNCLKEKTGVTYVYWPMYLNSFEEWQDVILASSTAGYRLKEAWESVYLAFSSSGVETCLPHNLKDPSTAGQHKLL